LVVVVALERKKGREGRREMRRKDGQKYGIGIASIARIGNPGARRLSTQPP
jgi:hypothetical protein